MTNYRDFYLQGHAAAQEKRSRGGFDASDFQLADLAEKVFGGGARLEGVGASVDSAARASTSDLLGDYHAMKKWKKRTERDLDEKLEDPEKAFAEWQRGWLTEAKIMLANAVLDEMQDLTDGEDEEDEDEDGDDLEEEEEEEEEDEDE